MATASRDKRALITGVTGQDGAYLARLLLDKGYEVHGIKRRSSSFNTGRIEDIYQDPHDSAQRFFLHYGDLTDATNLIRLVQRSSPPKSTTSPRRAMLRSVSKPPNTPPMPTASARCACWRRGPRASTPNSRLSRFRRRRC